MFYDVFSSLCAQKGVSCKRAALEIGLSNSIAAKWKKTGATPNGETLAKIAEYFEVPIGLLLGEEAQKEKPTVSGEPEIDMSDVDVAFYGDYKELSEDDQKTIRDMVRVMRERRINGNRNG